MSERTTARGKSGTACGHCGIAYGVCTEQVFQRARACCPSCGNTDTHDERAEPAAEAVWCEAHNPVGAPLTAATAHARTDECVHPHGSGTRVPRTWEIPAEPTGVDEVHAHDQDTGEPIEWFRTGSGWHRRGTRDVYTWAEVLARGPVVEGRPAPKYRPGFYRLRGELERGAQTTVAAGALVMVVRVGSTWAIVVSASGETGSITFDELTRAGAERVENP